MNERTNESMKSPDPAIYFSMNKMWLNVLIESIYVVALVSDLFKVVIK